jgi:hypothetical protein
MAYIFNRTANITQKHLAPRYRKGLEPLVGTIVAWTATKTAEFVGHRP